MSQLSRFLFVAGVISPAFVDTSPVQAQAKHCDTHGNDFVKVMVDMNPGIPGFQDFLLIEPETMKVEGIAVFIFDPQGTRTLWDIGYLGGINRGIAFGHVPSNQNVGEVVEVTGKAVKTIHPQNFASLEPGYDPLLSGPETEIQYVEGGFEAREPAVIPAEPEAPIFTANIELREATQGDVFHFFVGDKITVWFPGNGAFSVSEPRKLDTGGDVVPDGTKTLYGLDADEPVRVPPAAYYVDFVDGEGGAVIAVVIFGDADFDTDIDLQDFAAFQNCFTDKGGGPVARECAVFDFNHDGDVDLEDYRDFAARMTGP